MSMKRTSVKYISAAAIMAALATVDGWTARQSGHGAVFIGNAQARVGRPLTPASVAGVARRTTRAGRYGVRRSTWPPCLPHA